MNITTSDRAFPFEIDIKGIETYLKNARIPLQRMGLPIILPSNLLTNEQKCRVFLGEMSCLDMSERLVSRQVCLVSRLILFELVSSPSYVQFV